MVGFRIAILMAGFCSATAAIYAVAGVEPAVPVVLLLLFGPALSVGLWIEQDAHTTGVGAVMESGGSRAWHGRWFFPGTLQVERSLRLEAPRRPARTDARAAVTQAVLYALFPSLNN